MTETPTRPLPLRQRRGLPLSSAQGLTYGTVVGAVAAGVILYLVAAVGLAGAGLFAAGCLFTWAASQFGPGRRPSTLAWVVGVASGLVLLGALAAWLIEVAG